MLSDVVISFLSKAITVRFCTVIAAYQDTHDITAIIKNDDNDGFDVRIAVESSHRGPQMYRFVVIAVQ